MKMEMFVNVSHLAFDPTFVIVKCDVVWVGGLEVSEVVGM